MGRRSMRYRSWPRVPQTEKRCIVVCAIERRDRERGRLTYRSRMQTRRAVVVRPTQHVDPPDRRRSYSADRTGAQGKFAHIQRPHSLRHSSHRARAQPPARAWLGRRGARGSGGASAAARRTIAARAPLRCAHHRTRATAVCPSRPCMRGATHDAVDLTTSRRRRPSARCTAARHAFGRKTSRRCSTCPPWIACDPRGSRKQPSQAADRRSAAAGGLQADLARAATTHRPKIVSSPRYSRRALRRAMIKAFGSRPPHCRCRRRSPPPAYSFSCSSVFLAGSELRSSLLLRPARFTARRRDGRERQRREPGHGRGLEKSRLKRAHAPCQIASSVRRPFLPPYHRTPRGVLF